MKKINIERPKPDDADYLKDIEPVICYNPVNLQNFSFSIYKEARKNLKKIDSIMVMPRSANCVDIDAGHFFRIKCVDGAQVGDLNLWNRNNLNEFFYSGKTRALYGTHLSTKDRLWSSFPAMRPMATKLTRGAPWWFGKATPPLPIRLFPTITQATVELSMRARIQTSLSTIPLHGETPHFQTQRGASIQAVSCLIIRSSRVVTETWRIPTLSSSIRFTMTSAFASVRP